MAMTAPDPKLPTIFVDGDACPVKDEVYRVAERYRLKVRIVANAPIRVPHIDWIELTIVDAGSDVADDWIVERVQHNDIVITSDIPLASRCLQAGAAVIGSTGRPFTEDSIGSAMASRSLMEHLRTMGEATGGPKSFRREDRSRFLSALDEAVTRALRRL
jgi:uncharacterized protein YaiI (UPF0178 family)